MGSRPRLQRAVALFAGALAAGVLTYYVGPRYLAPLALWQKLVLGAAGVVVIVVIAVYSRRRAGGPGVRP